MKTVSNILKDARKAQGTDLIKLSNELKISVSNLQAIESGDIKKTPGDPYTLGFIKTYAEHFNLDVDTIVRIYKDETLIIKNNNKIVMPLFIDNSHYYYLKLGFASCVIVGFFALFYNFFYLQTNIDSIYAITPKLEKEMIALVEEEEFKQSLIKIKKYKEEQNIVKSYIKNNTTEENINISEEFLQKNNSSNAGYAAASISKKKMSDIKDEIILNILDDTWIHIKGSNKNIIISKLMKKNEKFFLNSNPYYMITTGNAGNIEILIENKSVGKLGKKGEVLNSFKLSPNFINN